MLKRLTIATFGAVLLLSFLGGPLLAQTDADMQKEIEALKRGQANIQKQLVEIKRLIQQQPRGAQPQRPSGPQVKDVTFDLANSVLKGSDDAKLTLIEFTDYQ